MTSCAYDQEFQRANSRISDLNTRIAGIEEGHSERFNTMSSSQAEILLELEKIRQSVKDLANRVEDNEHIIQHTVEKDLTEQEGLKTGLSRLNEISNRLEYLNNYLVQHHDYLGLEPMKTPEDTQNQAMTDEGDGFTDTLPSVSVDKPRNEALYETSLALFNSRQYSHAIKGFKTFLDEFGNSDQADNAQFWIGECFMALNQYDQAILSYQDVITNYPNGDKVPNAMLRQAIAWLEIGDKTSSEIILKNIIKQYPDSNEAMLARKKISTIK